MRRFLSLLRSIFVSPEVVLTSVFVAAWFLYPSPFEWGDRVLSKIDSIWVMCPFTGLIGSAVTLGWKICFPKQNAEVLAKWPEYPELRTTVFCGLFFAVVGPVLAAIGTFGRAELPIGISALLVFTGYWVAGIAVFTMLNAAMTVRAVMSDQA